MAISPEPQTCVLIVDDDEDTLELARKLVLQADRAAKVIMAHGAPQAMAYLLEASRPNEVGVPMPTLILLDVNMPGTGGFEVLRWVRHNQSLADIKVVMLSTSGSPADIQRATELGAHGYLIKFPNPAVLACVLHEAYRANPPDGIVRREHANHSADKNRVMQ